MKPTHPDWHLIEKLGGPTAVAKELDLPEASGVQTVQNWKYRGIPSKTKLSRPDLFLRNLLPQGRRTTSAS